METRKGSGIDKVKAYAYRLLAVRQRSEREMRSRLKEKNYPDFSIREIIGYLKDKGLIDDVKFARAWVDSRNASNPKGDIVLRQELLGRGVAEGAITKVLRDVRAGIPEEAQAVKLAAELKEKNKSLSPLKLKKKIHDFLGRRGFGFEVIDRCLHEEF